jgi:prepilin-type N-terminal cleavage/methylation domain-containing protein
MTGKIAKSPRQGFTLIELVAAMVLVGVVAVMAGAGFMSFSRIGEGKNYVNNAQLAQQRMELILAQKRTTSDFSNLDPCDGLSGEDFCDDVSVFYEPYDKDDTLLDSTKTTCNVSDVLYCEVHIVAGSQNFYMRLYHYE